MRKLFKFVFVSLFFICFLIVSCKDNITDEAFLSKLKVVFDSNGGLGEMADIVMNKKGEVILSSDSFYREGYIFVGWNTAADGSGTSYADGEIIKVEKDFTIYAQWLEELEVVYNGNGSTSGEMNVQKVGKGLSCILSDNAFVRTDYGFSGWNTVSDGSGTSYKAGDTVVITENLTLYAQWAHDEVTVTFNGNGSTSGSMEAQTVYTYTDTALTANGFSKTDYHFTGWNTAADGSGTAFTDTVNLTADTTLYAQWAHDEVTVTFNGNGSTSGSMAIQSVYTNTATSLTANGFARTGYHFTSWNTAADGSGTAFTDTVNLTADITLYAQWAHDEVIVTFNGNGSTSGSMEAQKVYTYTDTALTANGFLRTDYHFTGWNTAADGSGTAFTDTVNLTADTTLYAQWAHDQVAITFIGNGNTSGSMEVQYVDTNTNVNLSKNMYQKQGYHFRCWTNVPPDDEMMTGYMYLDMGTVNISKNITLYAQWAHDEVTVTFNGNGSTSGSMTAQTLYTYTDTALTENGFLRTDYHFTGWNTAADGTGTAFTDTVNLTADTTLYAQWAHDQVAITFIGNGNTSGSMEVQYVNTNTDVTLSKNMYQKQGYRFRCWTNVPPDDDMMTGYMYLDMGTVNISKNLTLYAEWLRNEVTVTFDGNGSTSGSMAAQKLYTYTDTALTENGFTKTDYHFTGWNTAADGSGTAYSDSGNVNLTENLTLYAQWARNQVTITFIGNGNTSGSMEVQYVDTNTDVTLSKNMYQKQGYRFRCWTNVPPDDEMMTGYMYLDMGTVNISKNLTLYAEWLRNEVTVTFDGNGSTSGSMEAQKVYTYTDTALNANGFSKAGYTFTGWNTAADGSGTAYSDSGNVNLTENLTLYAQWTSSVIYLTSSTVNWTDGNIYTLNTGLTIPERVEVTGDVTLLLTEQYWLTIPEGIHVPSGSSLTIDGDGILEVGRREDEEVSLDALIGGNAYGTTGVINLNGGVIDSHHTTRGAVLGSGAYGAFSYSTEDGIVNINGGRVHAYAQNGGAGIGSGYQSESNITVNISSGMVEATSSDGAAIGSGSESSGYIAVNITGGEVEVETNALGAGIGSGYKSNSQFEINISEGYVHARSTGYGAAIGNGSDSTGTFIINISGGETRAESEMNSDLFELKNARSRASAIGGGHDSNGGRITITGGTIITLVIPHIMDGTPFNVPGIGANDSICPVEISSEMQLYLGQNGVIWDPAENNEGSAPCMKVLPH